MSGFICARCVRPQVCPGHKTWKSLSITKAARGSGCRLHARGVVGFAEMALSNSKLYHNAIAANGVFIAAFVSLLRDLPDSSLTQDSIPDEVGAPLTPCPTCITSSSHLGSLPYSLSDLSDPDQPDRRCHKESERVRQHRHVSSCFTSLNYFGHSHTRSIIGQLKKQVIEVPVLFHDRAV